MHDETTGDAASIAVVGMACVFPGAHDPETLWRNVLAGRREFRRAPEERLPLDLYHDADPGAPGKTYCDQLAVITDWEFEPLEFGIPPVVARASEPTHWLALWCARAAFVDAGIECAQTERDRIAVMIGNSLGGEFARALYLGLRLPFVERVLDATLADVPELSEQTRASLHEAFCKRYMGPLPPVTEDSLAGTMSNTIAGRICNHFDLGGGGYTVDGACSSSLLSVAQACTALADREFDVVMCGGVDISLDPYELVGFAKALALARHDIRPYDCAAEGMIPGEGCGLFVLMREADARACGRRIRALVRGWGYSSDGASGMTAPRREGQVRAIRRAYRRAGYPLSSVGLIEGHGTGTVLGDQVELRALGEVLDDEEMPESDAPVSHAQAAPREVDPPGPPPRCVIGSIKGNIGHCKAAAGAAGLVKAIMALERKMLPPTAGCREPHPTLGRNPSRLSPALEGRVWPATGVPRRASVSGFGFGGANAHVTLEEHDPGARAPDEDLSILASAQDSELLVLSAPTRSELMERIDQIRAFTERISRAELTDLAATLAKRDLRDSHRLAVVAMSPWHARALLDQAMASLVAGESLDATGDQGAGTFSGVVPVNAAPPAVVMMFPGQGTQRLGMAGHLLRRYLEAAELGAALDRAVEAEIPAGICRWYRVDPRVLKQEHRADLQGCLQATELAQPAIVGASMLMLRVLEHLGLRPDVTLGHSLGLVSALAAKGSFDAQTAVRIAALRGRAMAELELADAGAMAAVSAGPEEVAELLGATEDRLAISGYNSPRQTTIPGATEAVEAFGELCDRRGVVCVRLDVSHAFHSDLVAPASRSLRSALESMALRAPDATVISTLSGQAVDDAEDLRDVLSEHVQQPVRFEAAVVSAARHAPVLWVEVGPGAVQCGFVREILGSEPRCMHTDRAQVDGFSSLDALLAQAYVLGLPVSIPRAFERRFYREFPMDDYSPRLIVNPCERTDDGSAVSAAPVTDRGAVEPAVADGDPRESALRFAMDWIASRTGFPRARITPEMRLRSDLNLDSIKATELVQALSARDDGSARGAPGLENATVAEMVAAILAANGPDAEPDGPDSLLVTTGASLGDTGPGADWSHTFRVSRVPAPLAHEPEVAPVWPPAVAVVAARESRRVQAVLESLVDIGLAPFVTTPRSLVEQFEDPAEFGALVWVLPEGRPASFEPDPARFDRALADGIGELFRVARWVLGSRGRDGGGLRWLVVRPEASPLDCRAADAGAAVLRSLRHEYPGLYAKWLVLSGRWPAARWGATVAEEIAREGRRVLYAYDSSGTRYAYAASLCRTAAVTGPQLALRAGDVVLVTGGAAGITAVLARALGEIEGVSLALVGRSPQSAASVRTAVADLGARGIPVRYYRCDITVRELVRELIEAVTRDQGPVTGVLHGAGASELIAFSDLGDADAARCIRVKVAGLRHLVEACPPASLKMLHVLSSVVAHTGMARQSDYALANAWIEGYVAELGEAYPSLHAMSLAYTLWRDTGRGVALGAVTRLIDMGITALDDDVGLLPYRRVLRGELSSGRLVHTGRLAPSLEMLLHLPADVDRPRFLEQPRRWIPGVELVAEATLSHEHDPYLSDHVVNGTPILPAVMGIEAMVSAAMTCAGRDDLPIVTDVRFNRAVVVPEGASHRVRVLARISNHEIPGDDARARLGNPQVSVRVALRCEADGFAKDVFAGQCHFGCAGRPPRASASRSLPGNGSSAVSAEQFVPDLLFQGQAFRTLLEFPEIRADGHTYATLRDRRELRYFGPGLCQRLSTPSPMMRDGMLQAAMPLLGRPSVALELGELEFIRPVTDNDDVTCHVKLVSREDERIVVDIDLYASDGRPVEALRGVAFRPVRQHAPAVAVAHAELPRVLAAHWTGPPMRFSCVRHDVASAQDPLKPRGQATVANLQAARRAVISFAAAHGAVGLDADDIEIAHECDGRPVLRFQNGATKCLGDLQVSVSDVGGISVAAVGPARLGVDIEAFEPRDGDAWRRLLGGDGYALALRIGGKTGESLSAAATRTWSLLEACQKALGHRPRIDGCKIECDGAWVTVHSPAPAQWRCLNVRLRARSDGALAAAALSLASCST